MSAKLVPTFANRGCRVVSATDLHGRNLDFIDRSRYYFFQVAPQLYSRGWVDPVPDPLFLRKVGSPGNWTRDLWICSQELWPLDHRCGQYKEALARIIIPKMPQQFQKHSLINITGFYHLNKWEVNSAYTIPNSFLLSYHIFPFSSYFNISDQYWRDWTRMCRISRVVIYVYWSICTKIIII
jgi:hypothetical protein